ncbi:MAG: zinc-dependent metalloprotease [Bacteroidota bacterium]
MTKYFPLLTFYFFSLFFIQQTYSQDLIERTQQGIQKPTRAKPNELAKMVRQNRQANARFSGFAPFTVNENQSSLAEDYAIGSIDLNVDTDILDAFIANQPASTTLQIPVSPKATFELELVKVDLFAEDFIYRNQNGQNLNNTSTGVFYRGIVKGDNNSIASASIFGDEIRILISDDDGNYVIGKRKGVETHVLYNDRNLLLDAPQGCAVGEGQQLIKSGLRHQVEDNARSSMMNKCIPIYVECDYDMYQKQGNSEANVIAFVSALVNETATIYANEQIDISLSDVKVWTTTDPYASLSSTLAVLQKFGELTKDNYNGRLAHFISTRNLGGGVAWVDVLCSTYFTFGSNHAGPYAVSASMGTSIDTFPTYSWNVEVFAHEMGHNMGSPHTQSCSWNGNNTAIDNCAPTEGGCSSAQGSCPPGGGTIMSYCHLTSCGIDFNNGFGQQPGNLIRNRYNNASCVLSCAAPTCDDNIQNGDEEGVDCGGSNCSPCPCYKNQVAFALTLDNYPNETNWNVRNAAGTILYSGGSYSQVGGSVNLTFNLPAASGYQFTITDSYGDGICCGYGNGSFSLTDAENEVIASGGAFGSSYSITFCTEEVGSVDNCPNDPNKTEPGTCGCGVADTDSDNDGTPNCNDACPNDPNKIAVGTCGCGVADTDSDNDGTPNCNDACPNDPNKIAAGSCGCGVADTDSDNDGTPNCNDACPNDPNKIAAGTCGCGVADTDSDNDGTPNCNDACPSDPNKIAVGSCGCGVADTDSDNDGTPNCNDACPNDPNKIAVGTCGCSVADTDSDNDGTPNCNDACPNDPNKIAAGTCGCGVADTDSDNDSTLDCNDACPSDPNKTSPGDCGCGKVDEDKNLNDVPDCNEDLNCPENQTISNNFAPNETYSAENVLSTTGNFVITGTATFRAGGSIILNPGFHAQAGSSFTAKIEGCNAASLSDHQDAQQLKLRTPNSPTLSDSELVVFPNPFQNSTTIQYRIDQPTKVQLQVMDLNGRIVQRLANQAIKEVGVYQVTFEGDQLLPGMYYVFLITPERVMSKKVVRLQ